MTLPGLESWQPQKKKPDSRLINVDSGFLWCFKMVGQVAGMFYFLRVKTRQPLDHSEMRGIWETVNRSNMGKPKKSELKVIFSYVSSGSITVRPEQLRTGVRSTSGCVCAELERTLALELRRSPIWAAQISCLHGAAARAESCPWAGFELQGCWVKFPALFSELMHAQRGHLLRGIYQKHLASSFLSEENTAQALCKATTLAGFWNSEIFALMKK